MSFEDVGAILKAEREKHRLSIEDVASQLKINSRQLRALENGDIGQLPHPAYAKGFLRSYGAIFGIGQNEIQRLLIAPKGVSIKKEKNDDDYLPEPELPPKKTGYMKYVCLILLFFCTGIGWYAYNEGFFPVVDTKESFIKHLEKSIAAADKFFAAQNSNNSADNSNIEKNAKNNSAKNNSEKNNGAEKNSVAEYKQPESTKTEKAKINAEKADKQENRKEKNAPQINADMPKVQNMADMQEDTRQKPAEIVQPVKENAQTAKEKTRPASQAAEKADNTGIEQHKLVITALAECWVHSSADNSDTRQFSLRKGDTFALTFSKNLELKLGNAGGVRIRYNGRDMAQQGALGEVKTLTFPPDNR